MILQGISTFCVGLNRDGLIHLEYAPISWINQSSYERIVSATYNWQYDIPFNQGGWMLCPLLPTNKLWTENGKSTKQGPYCDQKVEGIIPHLRPEVSGEFTSMVNLTFLLKLTDRNNKKWLLGSLDSPFQFFNDGTTGTNGS